VEIAVRLQDSGSGLPQEEWLPFSQTETRVLELLLRSQAMSREEIATALDESIDGRLKGVLATLTGRRVLLTTTSGYTVNAPEGRRLALRRWLESVGSREVERPG